MHAVYCYQLSKTSSTVLNLWNIFSNSWYQDYIQALHLFSTPHASLSRSRGRVHHSSPQVQLDAAPYLRKAAPRLSLSVSCYGNWMDGWKKQRRGDQQGAAHAHLQQPYSIFSLSPSQGLPPANKQHTLKENIFHLLLFSFDTNENSKINK